MPFLRDCLPVLARTPAALDALLRDLPMAWTSANEGPATWSPYVVVGHLIHCERANWMPRLATILDHGAGRSFPPFDREAQLRDPRDRPLDAMLDEFAVLRRENLARLEDLKLGPTELEQEGAHPALGRVTVRQLLAAWTGHDLTHLAQIIRVMAKRYKQEVGPWVEYLSVMK
jgi:hypothetical protein